MCMAPLQTTNWLRSHYRLIPLALSLPSFLLSLTNNSSVFPFPLVSMALARFPCDIPDEHKPFARSLSRKFTEQLTELRCHKKGADDLQCTNTFSHDNPPGIAHCGHLSCKSHIIADGKWDVFTTDFKCYENHDDDQGLGYFLQDKLLEDFFTAIAEGGVECASCHEVHPQQNSVRSFPDKRPPEFLCVWCAAMKVEEFTSTKLELISIDDYEKYKIGNARARSVNRDQKNAGWAMHMCCVCEKDMFNDWDIIEDYRKYPVASLSCGHLCQFLCFKDKDFKDKDHASLKCKICNTVNRTLNLHEIDRNNLGYPSMGEMVYCLSECKQKHPLSNCVDIDEPLYSWIEKCHKSKKGPKYWCVWCVVEKMVQDRSHWPRGEMLD